jgi:hypothetical protein
MAKHGRILDWAGESQYYVEEPGKTRERTIYTLTRQAPWRTKMASGANELLRGWRD